MSKSVSPKTIAEIVAQNKQIQDLRQQSKKLESIQDFMGPVLGPKVSKKVTVSTVENDFLVLVAESSTWASKIRYLVPLLLEKFAQDSKFEHIRSIRIRTEKNDRPLPIALPKRRMKLSADAADGIKAAADTIDDTRVAQALRRLLKNAGR